MNRYPLFYILSGLVVLTYYLVLMILAGMSGGGSGDLIRNLLVLPFFFLIPAITSVFSKKSSVVKNLIKISILSPLLAIPGIFWESISWIIYGYIWVALLIAIPLLRW